MKLLTRSEEIILLAIWKLKDNAYGVTIRDLVSKDTGHEWTFGAVYKPLKKLVSREYAAKKESGPLKERGGRTKFLYSLTPRGFQALKEMKKIHETIWTEEIKTVFG